LLEQRRLERSSRRLRFLDREYSRGYTICSAGERFTTVWILTLLCELPVTNPP
jgi:hypothetical protein